jgi:hypothetical protein
MACYIEPFALLVAQLAYEGKEGPQLAYRFERFGKLGAAPNQKRWATRGRLRRPRGTPVPAGPENY